MAHSGGCVDGYEGIPGPVLVCRVAFRYSLDYLAHPGKKQGRLTSDSVGVVETLNHFWAQVVQGVGDIEAIRIVECFVRRVDPGRVPAELLGPDPCEGGVVRVVAPVDKGEPKVDVVLSAKSGASKEEIPAVEAREVLGCIDKRGVDIACQECQVWSGCGYVDRE